VPINPRLTIVAGQARANRRLARSTVLVMGATLASTLLGFCREVVTARYFGASWQLDVYLSASAMTVILFGVFNGALTSALVPIFSDYVATGNERAGWRLASTVILTVTLLLSVLAVAGWLAAPFFVPLFARFPADRLPTAVAMTRWLMPTILATSLAGIVSSMLNAYQRFFAAAIQGVAANIVVIVTVAVGFPQYGIYSIVFGSLLGLFAQLLVQLPAFVALGLGRFAPVLDLRDPGLRRVLTMLGPIAIGSAAGQLALFFDRSFASGLAEGSIAGMNYATKIVGFPQQIFVSAIATVIFPVFASQFATHKRAAMRRSISTGLRMVAFLAFPSSLGLIALARPIVQVLFERGAFVPQATQLCASLLPFAAAGLVALAANVVLTRCTFACGEVRKPIAVAVVTVLVNIGLSVLWLPSLGARGLLLANTVSQSLQMIALAAIAWKLLGGFDLAAIFKSLLKVFGCSAIMYSALILVQAVEPPPEASTFGHAVALGEHLLFGAAIFLGLARLVNSDELHVAIDLLVRRAPRDLVPLP
jgi:putative peptidoglycan lipid II flippase